MTKLDTKTARAKLEARKTAYVSRIDRSLALGLRKGKQSAWIVRVQVGDTKQERRLGVAEESSDTGLSYSKALDLAQKTGAEMIEAMRDDSPITGSYTAEQGVTDFVKHLSQRRSVEDVGSSAYSINKTLRRHIPPALMKMQVADLTARHLNKWHKGLDLKPVTANLQWRYFRAALSLAFKNGLVDDDSAWRRVHSIEVPESAAIRDALTIEQVNDLLKAIDEPKFRDLCEAAFLTGGRLNDYVNARVAHVDLERAVWIVTPPRPSKKARPRNVYLNDEALELFARRAAGKEPDDLLFAAPDGEAWRKNMQQPRIKQAAQRAGLPSEVCFNWLRHSYISHTLANGAPPSTVADLVGTSVAMIEKTYRHLIESHARQVVASASPRLKPERDGKVVRLPSKAGAEQ